MSLKQNGAHQPVGIAERIFRFLASYGLSVVILFFLLLLTLLGTLEQAHYGLYVVQKKYFESVFLVHRFFDVVPVPLPGVYLLLVLLFVNLTCGGILRVRKNWRRPGVLIAHGGILFLLVGGFVAHHYSTNGLLQLYEGKESDEFRSYFDWVVEIRRIDPPSGDVLIIPSHHLQPIGPLGVQTFVSDELPFDLTVANYLVNSQPVRGANAPAYRQIEGIALQPLVREREMEANAAGAYVEVVEKGSGTVHEGLLWGYERDPFTVTIGDSRWAIELTHRHWKLPFTVHLDDFTVEFYPNTSIPKVFSSEITKRERSSEETIKISMNQPLRHKGYTLFQASWGPQNAPPGTPLFSGFAVVRNPADHWPLYSCIIVSIGMLIHFGQRLFEHLRRKS